jgi:hypothetical protein
LFRLAGFNGVGGFAGTTPERIATLLVGLANYEKVMLTEEQQARFEKMQGDKIEIDLVSFNRSMGNFRTRPQGKQ